MLIPTTQDNMVVGNNESGAHLNPEDIFMSQTELSQNNGKKSLTKTIESLLENIKISQGSF